ncbi:hypothetical protein D3C75_731430 [compost metagenome]
MPAQRVLDLCGVMAADADAGDGPYPLLQRIGAQAYRVADDHALLFEPGDAVLHGCPGHLELLRQGQHGGARVVPQQRNQFPIDSIHGCLPNNQIAILGWQIV